MTKDAIAERDAAEGRMSAKANAYVGNSPGASYDSTRRDRSLTDKMMEKENR